MNTQPETMKTAIHALATAAPHEAPDALARIPYDALGDDYRRNPYNACRKALRLTRSMRNRPNRRLRAIDRLLGMHGVESVREKNGKLAFTYANSGDAYNCTVILFASGTFRVSSWGDIVERNTNRFA